MTDNTPTIDIISVLRLLLTAPQPTGDHPYHVGGKSTPMLGTRSIRGISGHARQKPKAKTYFQAENVKDEGHGKLSRQGLLHFIEKWRWPRPTDEALDSLIYELNTANKPLIRVVATPQAPVQTNNAGLAEVLSRLEKLEQRRQIEEPPLPEPSSSTPPRPRSPTPPLSPIHEGFFARMERVRPKKKATLTKRKRRETPAITTSRTFDLEVVTRPFMEDTISVYLIDDAPHIAQADIRTFCESLYRLIGKMPGRLDLGKQHKATLRAACSVAKRECPTHCIVCSVSDVLEHIDLKKPKWSNAELLASLTTLAERDDLSNEESVARVRKRYRRDHPELVDDSSDGDSNDKEEVPE